jgi:2-C-methyl-D-erythritol 2,4-cyclodiphosphate synthase
VAEMSRVIGSVLEMSKEDISIKATTTEQMGFVGRGEGLVAYATVLLKKIGG